MKENESITDSAKPDSIPRRPVQLSDLTEEDKRKIVRFFELLLIADRRQRATIEKSCPEDLAVDTQ